MAAKLICSETQYTLELFPTEGNWDSYVSWLGGTDITLKNDNAGIDMYCVKDTMVCTSANAEAVLLDLGVKARMVKRWPSCQYGCSIERSDTCHFWLAPRSSIWKSGVRQANSLGVIDRSYRGVLMGAVLNNSTEPSHIKAGTRLFQVLAPDMGWISRVILRRESELDETSRGDGGFGSTGK